MRRHVLLVILAMSWLGSTTGVSQTQRNRPPVPPASAARPTFSETIAPILYANCVSCHRAGEAAPFSLITYEDVAKRGDLVAEVTGSRYMPPWHAVQGHGEFLGERRLTDAQIASINAWVGNGMPRGDASKMPKLPAFPADGWRLGTPDLILEMPVGFDLPASGPDVFRNFVIPTNLNEDKWVRAVEYRPSARKVVHHALFAQVPGGSQSARDGADGRPGFGGMSSVGIGGANQNGSGLGGWAVGAQPRFLPDGVALPLPKGADFLLQLHFHLTGKPETEKSLVGIYFAEKAPDKHLFSIEVPALFGIGAGINIPAGEKQFVIKDSWVVPGDISVFSATAHAHYLARDMKATATLPDGSTKPMIWINDWDFNWQDTYTYKAPFTLPKGTRIDVTISYDNSADNPRNPISPPKRALWGEQSFDEMGAVGFRFEALNAADVKAFRDDADLRWKRAVQAGGKDGTVGRFIRHQQRMTAGLQQLTIFDRRGTVVGRVGEAGSYAQASFSPDGKHLAVIKNDLSGEGQDVWTFDVETGKGSAITSDDNIDTAPVWSPDGQWIAYVSVRDNRHGLYRKRADGTGQEERLYVHPTPQAIILSDWSPDGRLLTFWNLDTMWLLPLEGSGDRQAIQLPSDEFNGRGGRFSPDGSLLAFNSNRSGRFEIYVKPIGQFVGRNAAPSSSAPPIVQMTQDGGLGGIVWRKDGRELFYLSLPAQGQGMMAVDLTTAPTLETKTRQRLFDLTNGIGAPAQLSTVSSADGQRFVFAVNLPPRKTK